MDFLSLTALAAVTQDPNMPIAIAVAAAHIAAAIALLNGVLTTLGQGKVAASAVESVARQPEAKGSIMTMMFIGCGFAETSGVYGLLIAFIMLFANPLLSLVTG